LRQTLLRQGFLDRDIITLSDLQTNDRHPTRANILRTLKNLANALNAKDRVVIYFSGHGAQVPQNLAFAHRGYVEPDGLDEVFLTRDTRYWNEATRTVEGAILDDEIGEHIARFTKKGVDVWAIFDTCHSGDLSRASTTLPRSELADDGQTIWRGVHPVTLGVPAQAITSTTSKTSSTRGTRQATAQSTQLGGLVEFFATQPNEDAPEELFAAADGVRRRHGVFSWELVAALSEGRRSFDDLAKAIKAKYEGRPFPTPMFRIGPTMTGRTAATGSEL